MQLQRETHREKSYTFMGISSSVLPDGMEDGNPVDVGLFSQGDVQEIKRCAGCHWHRVAYVCGSDPTTTRGTYLHPECGGRKVSPGTLLDKLVHAGAAREKKMETQTFQSITSLESSWKVLCIDVPLDVSHFCH